MRLHRPQSSIYQKARSIGLRKTPAFHANAKVSGRFNKLTVSGVPYRFAKGAVPANKGLRRPGWAPGRMAQTQFKKGSLNGHALAHYAPLGSYRINADGYLDRKVRDDGLPQKRWVGVHRLVWIEAHGRIRRGRVVVFKPGRRTTDPDLITVDALELVTRAQLMKRNSYHTNYPKELGKIIQLRGALTRQINRRERNAQN